MTVIDEDAAASLRSSMPLVATLGIEAIALSAELVNLRLQWRNDLCTTNGLLHGGVVMALADSAGGACAFANLPDGAVGTSTIESKTNFLRGVRSGVLEASARPLHVGRTVIVIETDVVDDSGRRAAKVLQTQAVLRPS